MMLLVVTHSRVGSTAQLADALVDGARMGVLEVSGDRSVEGGRTEIDADHSEVARLDVTEAGLDDVRAASGVVFCTPARFGALAGLTKDLLERIYPWFEEVPDVKPGMPWTAVAKGATDPSKADELLQKIDEISKIFWETKQA